MKPESFELITKPFEELTTAELYEILKARVDVFVVEQNCPYHELDDLDQKSFHSVLRDEAGRLCAYLRFFEREEGVFQIGRVLTLSRGTGCGGCLLHEAVERLKKMEGVRMIYLEAQTYAAGFYEKEGFQVVSEPFDEDGIPHVVMIQNVR
ncbi:MAG: GNAT family N-acetyltransferase [Solobacterium sp.]|nr:GNAT family N-acetyltransferase [Solobacterium sp.]